MASIELQRTDSLRSDIDYCGSDARGDGKLKDDTVGLIVFAQRKFLTFVYTTRF